MVMRPLPTGNCVARDSTLPCSSTGVLRLKVVVLAAGNAVATMPEVGSSTSKVVLKLKHLLAPSLCVATVFSVHLFS